MAEQIQDRSGETEFTDRSGVTYFVDRNGDYIGTLVTEAPVTSVRKQKIFTRGPWKVR